MAHTRYLQAEAVDNPGFRGLVEAALMVTAHRVLTDTAHPNYTQRAGLSRSLLFAMTPRVTVDNTITLFAWWCVNVPEVQTESYASGDFQPKQITDETIDAAVMAFWNEAAGVVQGGES